MKKPPNPNREWGRKTERLRLGFFSSNLEHALLLQKEFKQFDFYSYPVVTITFLEILGDPVSLVCFCSRGSRSRRRNTYCKESA